MLKRTIWSIILITEKTFVSERLAGDAAMNGQRVGLCGRKVLCKERLSHPFSKQHVLLIVRYSIGRVILAISETALRGAAAR